MLQLHVFRCDKFNESLTDVEKLATFIVKALVSKAMAVKTFINFPKVFIYGTSCGVSCYVQLVLTKKAISMSIFFMSALSCSTNCTICNTSCSTKSLYSLNKIQ